MGLFIAEQNCQPYMSATQRSSIVAPKPAT